MDTNKIREVIGIYAEQLKARGVPKRKFPYTSLSPNRDDALAHCHSMIEEIEILLQEDRLGKAKRWLGFIQGALWTRGLYSIEELKDHSKP